MTRQVLAGLVGLALFGSGALVFATPQNTPARTNEPLPITRVLQLVNQHGQTSQWFGTNANAQFPARGTFVITTWAIPPGSTFLETTDSTTTGRELFKAKLIAERVEVLTTDRDVDQPGGQ